MAHPYVVYVKGRKYFAKCYQGIYEKSQWLISTQHPEEHDKNQPNTKTG